jgi:hypothetical protein
MSLVVKAHGRMSKIYLKMRSVYMRFQSLPGRLRCGYKDLRVAVPSHLNCLSETVYSCRGTSPVGMVGAVSARCATSTERLSEYNSTRCDIVSGSVSDYLYMQFEAGFVQFCS